MCKDRDFPGVISKKAPGMRCVTRLWSPGQKV